MKEVIKYTSPILPKLIRELHKKDDPILWDGHLARPCIISGLFGPHHKKFWDIFLIGELLLNKSEISSSQTSGIDSSENCNSCTTYSDAVTT
ncbi:hypothetical protein NIES19_18570 [Anabaena cylindrica PCC 7122]|nr:hypothetical protein NIES19_18570 [Anabaena cylindrica PCC 7122]